MKNRLIVIEGPQGSGKTTLANYLRENIGSSNLYRLSGQKEKGLSGKEISKKMYLSLLKYLKSMEEIPMDLIFDRTFFTEEIYSRCGLKEYVFHDVYEKLLEEFLKLNYEIYLIVLYLENTNLYEQRLDRESHHQYQSFSLQNSLKQQMAYLELANELEKEDIHVLKLSMDDFHASYQKINDMFHIK